ncbi:MAG TPA: glycine cleavage system protein GcvH [Pirellulaceae bacterium]|nr:glycine cleavage system protein GcvH [Pirellulaceae bacterium]
MNPDELLFAETHEWAKVDDEGGVKVATVGISAFAVEQLTDLVYMELPSVGMPVEAGREFGEVESVKAVSPLYSPVTGEIIAVNSALPDSLETLNADPYNAGWILKVRLSDETALANLLDHAAYQKQCAEEG